jgi:ribosomal protein S6--L-glutamate ligase
MAKKKIILLTAEPKSFAQEQLENAAAKADCELDVINPTECFIYLSPDAYFADKGKKFENADACIPRLSENNLDYKISIIKHLTKMGVKVLNSGASMRIASNKIETQIILNDENIKTPKTALFVNEEQLESAVDAIGGKFPVIVKTIYGTHGVGVIRADSMPSLRSICQQLIKSNVEFMIQEFIEHKESARILVLGDEMLAAVMRTVPDEDFRSNAHQGSKLKKYDPSKEEIEVCLKAAELVGTKFSAIDYITIGDEIYVLEVNGSPGFEAMQEVIEFDIAERIIDYVVKMADGDEPSASEPENKSDETPPKKDEASDDEKQPAPKKDEVKPEEEEDVSKVTDTETGETETETDEGDKEDPEKAKSEKAVEPEKEKIQNKDFDVIGTIDHVIVKYFNDEEPIQARIDSGAEYCSINGTDIEVNPETILFTFNGTRYRFSKVKTVTIVSANGKQERPLIRLDIVINGNTYYNVEFTVNERPGLKYGILLGRKALAQANVLINPSTGKSLSDDNKKDDKKSQNSKPEEE